MPLTPAFAFSIGMFSFLMGVTILLLVFHFRGTLGFVMDFLILSDSKQYRTFVSLKNIIKKANVEISSLRKKVSDLEAALATKDIEIGDLKSGNTENSNLEVLDYDNLEKVHAANEDIESDSQLQDTLDSAPKVDNSIHNKADNEVIQTKSSLEGTLESSTNDSSNSVLNSKNTIAVSSNSDEMAQLSSDEPASIDDLQKRLTQVETLLNGVPKKYAQVLKTGLINRSSKLDDIKELLKLCKRLSLIDSDYRNRLLSDQNVNRALGLTLLNQLTEAQTKCFDVESIVLQHQSSQYSSNILTEIVKVTKNKISA